METLYELSIIEGDDGFSFYVTYTHKPKWRVNSSAKLLARGVTETYSDALAECRRAIMLHLPEPPEIGEQ